jgi:hypothetical protein
MKSVTKFFAKISHSPRLIWDLLLPQQQQIDQEMSP